MLALLGNGIFEALYFWSIARVGWQTRSVVATTVFRKSMRLSASAKQALSEGEIVNYMQIDGQRLETFILVATSLWDGLFQIAGYVIIIYFLIGDATFIGLAIMCVAIPIQGVIFFFVKKFLTRVAKFTDKRVKSTNEALQGMLGVKMAAWEENFIERIRGFRAQELAALRKSQILTAFTFAYIIAIPAVTAVGAISFYALQNGLINAATLFAVINAFSSLRFPLLQYPSALQNYIDARIAVKRLAKFLSMDESENPKRTYLLEDDGSGSNVITLREGEYFWANPYSGKGSKAPEKLDEDARKEDGLDEKGEEGRVEIVVSPEVTETSALPVLQDIDLEVARGSLMAVVGSVGVGKTSLLNSILGETFQSRGETLVKGSIAYAAQTAWIQNETLRENILFGQPFDEERYWRVIEVCQLEKDLDTLDDGDQTVIGEKGINLSGGQAQRVSVARAAYSRAEIVLLDDPISALDTEVGRALFEQCVVDFLQDRTRIMVTNQLNLLESCDVIVVLTNGTEEDDEEKELKQQQQNEEEDKGVRTAAVGRIAESGNFNELMNSGGRFAMLMEKFRGQHDSSDDEEGGKKSKKESGPRKARENKKGKELMQVEERAHGAVKAGEYLTYVRAGGGWIFFSLVILFVVLTETVTIGNSVVITVWTDNVRSDGTYINGSLDIYLIIYASSALVLVFVSFLRGLNLLFFGLRAARKLHNDLLDGVLRAPMSFFDTTPTGRVVSRFSKDINSLDLQLPQQFNFFLFSVFAVIFAIGTIVYTVWYFAIAIPFLMFLYFKIVQYYRPVSRDAKRLESISRSPVYAYFTEALGGLPTIRAYSKVDDFNEENSIKIDRNIRGFYNARVVEMWLAVRLRLLSSTIAGLSCVLIILAVSLLGLTPGVAGLGLTMMLTVTLLLGNTIRSFALLEAGMNSVERVHHYASQIESEAPGESQNPPPDEWPAVGEIVISDLEMRYRPGTRLVLRGLSVTVPGGATVGIVGRTGSGKSSLMLALLRIVEAAAGSIVIDGIDISTIGLKELRKKVSIVPQSPVIFSGTIRSNLDPFGRYSDEELWQALERANMKRVVEELDNGLDGEVAEYGSNFSQGQRQLLCMARSLLAQAKILLMDEATSAIDYETDAMIQETIRNSFTGCTILTIAHRIQTVIDNDYILVIDAGTVAEFDKPSRLLEDPQSEFSAIVNEMPAEMAANLRQLANTSGSQ